jgi:hypothetical protein
MSKIWRFVTQPQNLAVLVAAGGGLAFVLKELVIPHIDTKPHPAVSVQQSATATGGTAINAEGNSQVSIGATLAAPASAAAPVPANTASQTAQAMNSGIAVNAGGAARVSVNRASDPR